MMLLSLAGWLLLAVAVCVVMNVIFVHVVGDSREH